MKLGELITALEDYKLHTIGVDEDTEVRVSVPDIHFEGTVDDVKVMLIRSSNQYTSHKIQATVILEVEEQ